MDFFTNPTATVFYGDVKRKENEDTKNNAHSQMDFFTDPTATAFYGDVKQKKKIRIPKSVYGD
ncbi:hypothetical protein FRX31_008248 [Thalictrum thalictroides]|uniref:Uncharacterized protein n=1 Tax=Thalictrum thalictroides TaxID=46969 RepID=A0A7J6WXI4_THATH|nr:hypothetical protein FRX31_008248 [Thalictrum thalictroides]